MPEGTQVIVILVLALSVWAYSYVMEKRRKRVDDEFGQLERRKVEALERIAAALEKGQ